MPFTQKFANISYQKVQGQTRPTETVAAKPLNALNKVAMCFSVYEINVLFVRGVIFYFLF